MANCIPLALPLAAGATVGGLLGKHFGENRTAVAVGAGCGLLVTALFNAYVLGIGGVSGSWELFGCGDTAALSPKLPPAPGPGATTTKIGIMAGLPFSMTRTVWDGAQSSAQGSFYLIQNASNPNDWALQFVATGATKKTSVLNQGNTANSALIAQAIASGQ